MTILDGGRSPGVFPRGSHCELAGEAGGGAEAGRVGDGAVSRSFEVGGGRMREEQGKEQTRAGGVVEVERLGRRHGRPTGLAPPEPPDPIGAGKS